MIAKNSMEDFGALLDAQLKDFKKGFSPGQRVSGTVSQVTADYVLVDLHAKSEGMIPRAELCDETGRLKVKPGDNVEAYFVSGKGGSMMLSVSFAGAADREESLRHAFQSGMPVEGIVRGETRGGYEVGVGKQRVFCPYSEVDITKREPADVIGKKLAFIVIEFEDEGKSVVVSHREVQQRERDRLRVELEQRLKVDDVVEGTVARIMPFGVFVDIGGADGLVPLRELTWASRNAKPEDVVTVGERVRVVVREIKWEENRISLSLRYAQGDPWQTAATRYLVGMRMEAVVTRLMPFGAFAELEPGVEGLIPIGRMAAGRRIAHPKEVLKEEQRVEVQIDSIDLTERKIGLSLDFSYAEGDATSGELKPGDRVTGMVESIKEFGAFIKLPGNKTGLLHVSEAGVSGVGPKTRALFKKFTPGSSAEVVVRKIEGDRISLTTPEAWETEQDKPDVAQYLRPTGSSGLGSLGDAFEKLKL